MDKNKKMEMLKELFEMEDEVLTTEMELSNMECWNSMTKLSLIVLMDDEFGKKISGEQIKGFKTVQDILNYME